MDLDDWFVWLVIVVASPYVLSIWALVANRKLRRQIERLAERFHMVDHRLVRLGEAVAAQSGPVAEAAAPAPPSPPAPAPAAEIQAPEPPPALPPPAAAAEPEFRPAPVAAAWKWEQRLAENWLVWLGGATLALGGAFLVKLSIDYNLMTPPVRVILAALLGIGLAAGADRLARRERLRDPDASPIISSPVAQALAAAGAATVFASIYAAYQLYGLLGGELAFPLLAVTAGATIAMSLRHGPYVAALGLIGAYVVPALVESAAPQAVPLFAYLAIVTAASLALLRHRAWWWLGWLSLAGAIVWPLLWLGTQTIDPEGAVVAVYLLCLLGLFAAFRIGVPRIGFLDGTIDAPQVRILTRVAFWLVAAAMIPLLHADNFALPSLAAAFAAAAFTMWFCWRDQALDDLVAVAGILLALMLATWELPLPTPQTDLSIYGRPPAQIANFLTAALLTVLLLGGGGFALLGRVARPGRWAALSAAAAPIVLIVAYWRLHHLVLDLGWSSLALTVAAIELGAASLVGRRRTGEIEPEIAFAAYAIGVLSGTIIAATFALSTAWLTVALALHLPAMGWIEGRVRAPVLRWLALGVAGAVLVRLFLNPYVLAYPLSATPIFNWLLYGYGVPALAFIAATRQFGSRADDLLVAVLEGGSAIFTTALLTLELRHALYGRIDAPFTDLGRDSTQSLLWLGLAARLHWLGERRRRPVLRWGGTILFAVATVQIVLWQVMIADPFLTGEPIGAMIVFDRLTLAYALPALIYAGIALYRLGRNRCARCRDSSPWLCRFCG